MAIPVAAFHELIRRVLDETGLAPQYLELELPESLVLSNADVTFSVLRELKTMGLKLAIDDFGTGYFSLSYLKQFPVSKLKIDRSFVRDIAVHLMLRRSQLQYYNHQYGKKSESQGACRRRRKRSANVISAGTAPR
jgi:EAL domain-containing protein (putative c-di-GMP-specific phosphodiesterase class I)